MPGEVNRMDGNERFRQVVHNGNPTVLGSLLAELGKTEAKKLIDECYREQPETALVHCAKRAGDGRSRKDTDQHECIRELLSFGAQINEADCTKRTALHWSCWHNNETLSTLLLDRGADPSLLDAAGFNCLLTAVSAGALECVRLVLAHRKDLLHHRGGGTGITPLLAAVQKGDANVVAALVTFGADVNSQEDASQRTALHYALYTKKREIFEYLLQHGADLTRTDHRGTNILHRCCTLQDPSFLRLVITAGQSAPRNLSTHGPPTSLAQTTPLGTALRMGDSEGATPVIVACQNGNLEQLKMLVETGAPVASKDKFQRCALHHCVENPATECAEYLLRAIPSLLTCADEEGLTPLHMAVIAGNAPLVRLLLKRGANLRAVDNEKHTVVHWATVCGHAEVLDILIENGADVSTPDKHQAYPIHYAAQMMSKRDTGSSDSGSGGEGGLQILKTLLKHKVSPEAEDKDKRTPIIWAASAGSGAACRVLVSAGADVNRADKDDLTALHCAASRGHHACVEILVKNCKAAVDPVDKNQCTPLFYATTLGHVECMKSLLSLKANCKHTDTRGRTAAHCATVSGLSEALGILKFHNVDLWTVNLKGDLPLHEAAQAGHLDLVQYLLEHSDERPRIVDAGNKDGRTCLHIAALTNNIWLCRLLIERGANINAIMRNKGKFYSPYDAALIKGHSEAKDYLYQQGGRPGSQVTSHAAQTIQVQYRYHKNKGKPRRRKDSGKATTSNEKGDEKAVDGSKRVNNHVDEKGADNESYEAPGHAPLKGENEKSEKEDDSIDKKSGSVRKSSTSSSKKSVDSKKVEDSKHKGASTKLGSCSSTSSREHAGTPRDSSKHEEKTQPVASEKEASPPALEAPQAETVKAVGAAHFQEPAKERSPRSSRRSKDLPSSASSSASSSPSPEPNKRKYVEAGTQITTGATEVCINGETIEKPVSARQDSAVASTERAEELPHKEDRQKTSLTREPEGDNKQTQSLVPSEKLPSEKEHYALQASTLAVSPSASRRGHRSPKSKAPTPTRQKRSRRDNSSDSEKSYRSSSSSPSHGTTSDIESSGSERLSKSKETDILKKNRRNSPEPRTASATKPLSDQGDSKEAKKSKKKPHLSKDNEKENTAVKKAKRESTAKPKDKKDGSGITEHSINLSPKPAEDHRSVSPTSRAADKSEKEQKVSPLPLNQGREKKATKRDRSQKSRERQTKELSESKTETISGEAKDDSDTMGFRQSKMKKPAPVAQKKVVEQNGAEYTSDFISETESDQEDHEKKKNEDDEAYTDMEDAADQQNQSDRPKRRKTRPNKLIQSIQESVRRYEHERQSIRQLHQIRRAQIYSGPTWDVALFRKIVEQHGGQAASSQGEGTPHSAATVTAVTWEEYLQEQLKIIQEERKTGPSPRKVQSAHPQSRDNTSTGSKRTPRSSFRRSGDTSMDSHRLDQGTKEKNSRQQTSARKPEDSHLNTNGSRVKGDGISPLRRAQTARVYRSSQPVENHQHVTTSPLDMTPYDDPRKFSSREATRLRHEHAQMQLVKAYRPFGGMGVFRSNTSSTGFPPPSRGGIRPQSTMSSKTSASGASMANGRPCQSRGASRESEYSTIMTSHGSRRVRTPGGYGEVPSSQYARPRYPLIFKDPDEYEKSKRKQQDEDQQDSR